MRHEFLKQANCKTDKEFYAKFPTEESFFKSFPQAKYGATLKKAFAGDTLDPPPARVHDIIRNGNGGRPLPNGQPIGPPLPPTDLPNGQPILNMPQPMTGPPMPDAFPNMPDEEGNGAPPKDPRFKMKWNSKLNSTKGQGINTSDLYTAGIQMVASAFPEQKAKSNIDPLQRTVNPYASGTGSHATFAYGGNIPIGADGLQVENNQFTPLSSKTVQVDGKYHTDGGTNLAYGGNPVEAEKGETFHVDSKGNGNIGGNMYLPDSNSKFKDVFKDIARIEKKDDKLKDKSAHFLNSYSPTVKYQAPAFNTGKVLSDAYEQNSAKTGAIKEYVTNTQNKMLELADYTGMKPETVSKMMKGSAKYGMSLPKAAPGISLQPETDIEKNLPGIRNDVHSITSLYPNTINTPAQPYEPQQVIPGLEGDSTLSNLPHAGNTNKKPVQGARNKFSPLNYLGEIAGIFDQPQPVNVPGVQPIMEGEYNISLQQKKNSIISAFKPAMAAAANNPAQQSAIAAQMAEQLGAVDSEEFGINQQNRGGIQARNAQELRGVRDTTLKLSEDQQNKQAQALATTKENHMRAAQSFSTKENQRLAANNDLSMYEQYTGQVFNPATGKYQRIAPDYKFDEYSSHIQNLDEETSKKHKKHRKLADGSYDDDEQATKPAAMGMSIPGMTGQMASRYSTGTYSKPKKKKK